MEANWKPKPSGNSYETKNIWGDILISEQVSFIPDCDINCQPPYIKGKPDCCWVKYLKGARPTTKEGWESLVCMKLQTMLF